MPEFYASHTPAGLDDFTRGYFDAAEWLWPDEPNPDNDDKPDIDRGKVRGWSRDARRAMVADCRQFQRDNAAALADYCALRNPKGDYTAMECAGHDFFLTREGHGSGFWDRGDAPVFRQLADAARAWGEYGYPYMHRGFVRI